MQSWMIGMVSGTIFAGTWPVLPPWPLLVPLALLSMGVLRVQWWVTRVLCGVCCGCCLGLAYGTVLLDQRLVADCVGTPLTVEGQIISLPVVSEIRSGVPRQRFEFSVSEISPARCHGPSKLMLSYYGDDTLLPGENWRFDVKLKKPWGLSNPGSYNVQAWFAQEGIDGVGSVKGKGLHQRLPSDQFSIYGYQRVRWTISGQIGKLGLKPDVMAMLRALTVADRSGIGPDLWRLLQQYGVNHLLVISGLHVGLVAAAGFLLGGVFVRLLLPMGLTGNWLPSVCALLLATAYGALAGFSLPVQRALCMLVCFVAAGLTSRSSGPSNNLLLAATVVLVMNPLAALGSGFWLSFGAVAALLWLAQWQRGAGALRRILGTHGFMSLVMLPLGALFFGGASLVAMLANLLMITLVGMVVVPLSLMAVVSSLCGWAVASDLWNLAGWPLQQLLPPATQLAEAGDKWLFLHLTGSLPRALLGLTAVGLLILPGAKTLKLLALVSLLPLLLPQTQGVQTPSLDTSVTVLDVGQGTSVVIRSGERTLLYDTGGGDPDGVNMGSSVVLPYLRQQGVASLDSFVISHPDLDHSAGAEGLLAAMPVERFRYGGDWSGAGAGRPCIAGEAWRWPGGQVFQFLSPARESQISSNDASCVLQVQMGRFRLLLPGDIGTKREQDLVKYWGDQLSGDWLLAAHHGSRTSSSPALLKWVYPETIVVSSGYANRFGHPHPQVLQRLQQLGGTIFSTATHGALEFELSDGGDKVETTAFRQATRRYWM